MKIRPVRKHISESLRDPTLKDWRYFHISLRDLGKQFLFTPRLPRTPYEDINGDSIEDVSTKRTSWATDIRKALFALMGDEGLKDVAYVYATNDIDGLVDIGVTFYDCPSAPEGNEYGPGFEWKKYEDEMEKERKMPIDKDEELRHCVPDAVDTGEVWAISPVMGTKIGTIKNGAFIPAKKKNIST